MDNYQGPLEVIITKTIGIINIRVVVFIVINMVITAGITLAFAIITVMAVFEPTAIIVPSENPFY